MRPLRARQRILCFKQQRGRGRGLCPVHVLGRLIWACTLDSYRRAWRGRTVALEAHARHELVEDGRPILRLCLPMLGQKLL